MPKREKIVCWILTLSLSLCGCGMRVEVMAEPEATPAPTATPAPEQEDALLEKARQLLENMTLEEKVGQLFFVRPDVLDPYQSTWIGTGYVWAVTAMSEKVVSTLVQYPVGGVVVFGKNIKTSDQLKELTAALQRAAKTPLFLAVDEEGGQVARLANHAAIHVPEYKSAAAVGASRNTEDAADMGRTIGGYLADYGFSMDFAPVADVNTNPDNPIIGDRAFSSDAGEAAAMAGAMAEGLASQGVIPVYKHFPGHGDTAEDSHLGIAVINKTAEELMECEWLPYLTNDLTGSAVMVGHIAAPSITGDMTPASLSRVMVTDYLRGELGFQGLVITDSLAMAGITQDHTSGEAAVLALEAGCDVLLMPEELDQAYDAVLHAVETGEITEERIDESVLRILQYKIYAGVIE